MQTKPKTDLDRKLEQMTAREYESYLKSSRLVARNTSNPDDPFGLGESF